MHSVPRNHGESALNSSHTLCLSFCNNGVRSLLRVKVGFQLGNSRPKPSCLFHWLHSSKSYSSFPFHSFLSLMDHACLTVSRLFAPRGLWPSVGLLSPWDFQARTLERAAIPPPGAFLTQEQTCISRGSCIGRCILYHWVAWGAWFLSLLHQHTNVLWYLPS